SAAAAIDLKFLAVIRIIVPANPQIVLARGRPISGDGPTFNLSSPLVGDFEIATPRLIVVLEAGDFCGTDKPGNLCGNSRGREAGLFFPSFLLGCRPFLDEIVGGRFDMS